MDSRRRTLLAGAAGAGPALLLSKSEPPENLQVLGTEHWPVKDAGGEKVRLFAWRKRTLNAPKGALVFVHGSSVQSTPVFDLQVPGKPEYSVMDWFARLGYDTWCFDCEGYGRSDKSRPINADIATGADDLQAVADYVARQTGSSRVFLYGASSGALRAALYAQRHPQRVARIALDAFVWTGDGSPTLAERRRRLPEYKASNRRPIDRAFIRSIFTRDGAGEAADPAVVEAFADAVLALDDSMPTGTYVDMTEKLPLIDPERFLVPTLILRGQWDGIATLEDVMGFFARIRNADKQLAMIPAGHVSLRSRNWQSAYHLLDAFFSQPPAAFTGS
ncbi:MAG: alpha/beta fold hydrolase [Betaproteobacteria bacterium]|nr:alpha/beta fold hydrolase [Betaproteobacteria bacterium]